MNESATPIAWKTVYDVFCQILDRPVPPYALTLNGYFELPRAQRAEHARRHYCTHSKEISAAVAKWRIGDPPPELEGEAELSLRIRAKCAYGFVMSIWLPDPPTCGPFLFSSDWTPEASVKFLLTEWFESTGWREALASSLRSYSSH